MSLRNWEIRDKYKNLVKRYDSEKDTVKKIQMRYKFIDWYGSHSYELTSAEQEYLQSCICPVIE